MAKQLNVNLAFNADTSGAIKNLNELNTVLSKIGAINISSNGISAEMKQAALSAQELQMHLNKAYDSKLGNLNLSKFEQSLKSSSTSLSKLSTDLLGAGRNGEQAFLRLQSSIASANTQLIQSQGLLSNFLTSLKNTARWQISSSILHGFMGTIQSAYSYSQRLNESLNNIRIVTGQNVDQMAAFAEQANKAAKALGTSTTEYTNASLIYYQQGLRGDDVAKRTDVTVKMANVANKTAQEVSDQMTAVWNNFYDGSKSLEYYADVMTALGAATASSTDEIAGGLEKFAAVADTIGLSYEYAAAALATITSNTRQSEEVVGTALKTIFARIQGLNLGETLDDGTTLNKYSEALQKVGISIFDTAGNLRDMDDILDDMGDKWEHLNKAQQTALAQTVAGTRQYTQLVALMDNWNKGDADSFQSTLATAYGAEGSLTEQHDIYLQGWEAAQKKVRAGFEAIYKELVPDEAFTDLYNGFADVLGMIEAIIKTMGGLEGIIMLAATVMLNKFAPAIGDAFNRGLEKLKIFKTNLKETFSKDTGATGLFTLMRQGKEGTQQLQSNQIIKGNPYKPMEDSTARLVENMRQGTTEIQKQQAAALRAAESETLVTEGFKSRVKSLRETTELTNIIKANASNLSKETSEELMAQIRKTQELGEQQALLVQQKADIEDQINRLKEGKSGEGLSTNINVQGAQTSLNTGLNTSLLDSGYLQSLSATIDKTGQTMMQLTSGANNLAEIVYTGADGFARMDDASSQVLSDIIEMSRIMEMVDSITLNDNFNTAEGAIKNLEKSLGNNVKLTEDLKNKIATAFKNYHDGTTDARGFQQEMSRILKTATNMGRAFKLSKTEIEQAEKYGRRLSRTSTEANQAARQYAKSWQDVKNGVNNALKSSIQIVPTLAKGFSTMSSAAMSINMISNAFDTITDSSTSWTQKLSSGLMAASMAFQSVLSVSNLFQNGMKALTGIIATQNAQLATNALAKAASAAASKTITAAEAQEVVGSIALGAAKALENKADEAHILTSIKKGLQRKLNITGEEAETLAVTILNKVKSKEITATEGVTNAKAGELVMTESNTAANWKEVASLAAKHWILLVIIAALAVLAAGIMIAVNAEKKRVEANKQSAEAAQEAAEAAKQEAEANRELADSYREALKTYQETGEGKAECQEAALAAAEAYGIEGAEVLILAGRYEELNKQIREKQKLENKEVKGKTDLAAAATSKAMVDALETGDGGLDSDGVYSGYFDNGASNEDEIAAYKAIKQGNYQFLSREDGEIFFNVANATDPASMYQYFQELEQFLQAQREIAEEEGIDLGASEIYQDAMAEYQEGLEYYEELKVLMEEAENLGFDTLALETTSRSGKGINEIETLEEYESFRDRYLKQQKEIMKNEQIEEGSAEWERRLEAAETYLGTLDEVREFYLESKGFEDAGYKNEIKEWYDTLSEEDQSIFWQLDIDEDASLEETKSAMKRMQDYVKSNNLIATFKVTTSLEDLVSSDDKDWEKIREQMFDLWKKNGMDPDTMWYDFLAMSDEERVAHVRGIGKSASQGSAYTAVDNIASSKDAFDTAQGEFDTAKSNFDFIYDEWQEAADIIADYKTNASSFYQIAQSENTSDRKLFGFKGDAWSTLLDSEYVLDSKPAQAFVDYVTGGITGYKYAEGLNINDDNQALMHYLKGAGNGYDNYVMIGENGRLQWNPDYIQFDEKGVITGGSASMLGESLDYLTYSDQAQYAQSGGHYAARYIADHDSAFTEDRSLHQAANRVQSTYNSRNNTLYGIDGTADGEGGLEQTFVEKQNALTVAGTAYENNLIAQNEWVDAFEKQTENLDLDPEEVETYADNLLTLAENGEVVASSLLENENAAKLMAQGIVRMNKGVKELSENWEDQSAILSDSSKTMTQEYANAVKATRGQVEDILDLDMSGFSDGWFTSAENMALFSRIAQGDLTAIDELRMAAAEEIIVQISGDDTELQGDLEALLAQAQADLPTLQMGASLDTTQFGQDLIKMVNNAQISVDEANRILEGLGFEPQITYLDVPLSDTSFDKTTSTYTYTDPVTKETYVASIDSVLQSGTAGNIKIPIINGSKTTYKGSGASTATPPPANNKGGGGGGGSKPKPKNDQDKERYHTLQNQLEDLKSEYDNISEAADRAFGKDKLKLIDDQIAKTDEMIAKQKEYVEAIQENLPRDKAILDEYYKSVIGGPAIQYDEKGNISNYDEIQDAMYAVYNANADSMGEEDWTAWEEKYGKLEKYIEQYEETYDLLRDEEQAYQELLNQRLDQELAKIQYQIELKISVADDGLEVLEYQLGRLEDDAFAAAEAIALFGDKAELLYDKMEADRQGLNDILGQQLSSAEIDLFMSGDLKVLEGKTFTEAQMEQIREYRSDLLSLNEEMLEVRDSVQEQVMETFDAWNEKLQEGIDKFEHYNSVMSSYKNIIDLVGKSYLKVDNTLLKSLNDAMIENSLNKVESTRVSYESLLQAQVDAQVQYQDAIARGNENDIKFWEETLKSIETEVGAAQENMMSAWEEALQVAADEFQRQVEVTLEEFNKALTGFATLDQFKENFDFGKEVEEQYVPAYEKIYELSKLNRDINKTLNDDRVIKGKEKLVELQNKLNKYQEDGVEMSKYEIENLQREYDLRMAEIALEEARNAKDTVRMSKDNEGNWSYVYTTNTDAVDEAQQKYEDALFAMQQSNHEYMDEMSELILDATTSMQEEIADLRLEDFTNQAEYDAAVQEIVDKYMARIEYGQDQMQLAVANNAILYEQDWAAYSAFTGYKIAASDEFVDSFKETLLGKLLGAETDVVNIYDLISEHIGQLIDGTGNAYEEWSNNVDNANAAAGTSTEDFAADMNNAVNGPDGIAESSGTAADAVQDMATQMQANFTSVTMSVGRWETAYSDAIDNVVKKNLEAIDACNLLLKVLSEMESVDTSLAKSNSSSSKYDPYGTNYKTTTNNNTDKVETLKSNDTSTQKADKKQQQYIGGGRSVLHTGIGRNIAYARFASGGYTGEWGPDGRLALLDEKELVLNSQDTANMLKAVDITRQILDTIDLNAQYASAGLGQVMASSIRDSISQTLEQSVMIQAEFPSVTEHNEIELAIRNLVNTASQYAHRK